jgi:hypothetical protein
MRSEWLMSLYGYAARSFSASQTQPNMIEYIFAGRAETVPCLASRISLYGLFRIFFSPGEHF